MPVPMRPLILYFYSLTKKSTVLLSKNGMVTVFSGCDISIDREFRELSREMSVEINDFGLWFGGGVMRD